ncbi:hypothetical protein L9F63_028142, partial [Diploptera punctata]
KKKINTYPLEKPHKFTLKILEFITSICSLDECFKVIQPDNSALLFLCFSNQLH